MSRLKEGDIVWCKPGYENGKEGDSHYGGSGYWEGRVFVINRIDDRTNICWPCEHSTKDFHPNCAEKPKKIDRLRINNGVYSHAVELYVGQDIDLYNTLKTIKEEIYGEES